MANNTNSDKIDMFLDGELSGTERAAFEADMENDPQLEEEVLANVLLRETIEAGYREEMRANIRKWRTEDNQVSRSTQIRKLTVRLAAAASVLLVFGLAVFNLVIPNYSNPGILSDVYIQETDLSGGLKAVGEADVLQNAINTFEQGNFEAAIPLFQQFPDNDQALYGLGQSYLNTDNYDQAITTFQAVIDRGNVNYIEKAEYYLVLTYLEKGELNEQFYDRLNKIAETGGGIYKENAQKIQRRLNSFWRSFQ